MEIHWSQKSTKNISKKILKLLQISIFSILKIKRRKNFEKKGKWNFLQNKLKILYVEKKFKLGKFGFKKNLNFQF